VKYCKNHPHPPRKGTNLIPSLLGEGQADMPIAQANQGEVLLPLYFEKQTKREHK
jgi:hypothetical protein